VAAQHIRQLSRPASSTTSAKWKEFHDAKNNAPYYFNEVTKQTVWVKPADF